MSMKLVFPTVAVVIGATSALGCPAYDPVVSAVQNDDAVAAAQLYEEIVIDGECTDDLREWVGDYLARETFIYAVTGAPTAKDRRDALEQALGYEKHWRTYNELGLMDWEGANYAGASQNFQLAISELVDGDQSHTAENDEIAELYQMASAAVALSGEPKFPTTRSGATGGIFSMKIRGFEVVEVPLPITFEFDSSEFDEIGKKFAAALVEHVASINPGSIALVGHTDPRGTDEYNLGLSIDRAEAVGALLKGSGFEGEVSIEGRGESELPAPPRGIEKGSEEHYRVARRVVFSVN